MTKLLAWLRLARVSNLPTAWSNILMGAAVTDFSSPVGTIILLLASSCLYTGGIILNDVCDVDEDRDERPNRILPQGLVALAAARTAAWGLLVLGVVAAVAAGLVGGGDGEASVALRSGGTACVLVLAIVCYDAGAKATLVGPLVMGSCRMLNVLLGMSLHQETGVVLFSATHWWIAVCIGLFVAGLTWFARSEQSHSARLALMGGAGAMLAGIVALALLPFAASQGVPGLELPGPDTGSRVSRFVVILVVMLLPLALRVCGAIASPGPANVQRAVVAGLMALILIDASVCYLFGHTTFSFSVALLIVPGAILGRWIRGT